jgi:hypothetical protein
MKRYFFDMLDQDSLILDDEGIELPNVEAAQKEAARSLADMVKEDIHNQIFSNVSVQVRDGEGPVLEAKFVWEVRHTKH